MPGSASVETGRPFKMKSIGEPRLAGGDQLALPTLPSVTKVVAAPPRCGVCRPARSCLPGDPKDTTCTWVADVAPEEQG